MPATQVNEKLTSHPGSDLRQVVIQHNNNIADNQAAAFAQSLDLVWSWQTAVTASLQALGRGSTDTNIGSGAFTFSTGGMPEKKAAVAAGTAIGAQTVPADTWAVYSLDIATGGTITVSAGAANATTGYATEALAIAAVPARVTAKARMGYITLKTKAATAWVAATDALAGGSSGNPASTTNYYPFDGVFAPTGVETAGTRHDYTGGAFTGGRNGVLIPTTLARGSTDTNLATIAFTFSANGITNIAKAAVAAGTAFGALGTIAADTWGLIVAYIDAGGTISFQSAPGNYSGDYRTEAAALGALFALTPPTGKCRIGYITVKTAAGLAWIAGTDALAGGTTGNEASVTNYYPQAGITLLPGMSAAQIANRQGVVVGASQY